MPDAPRRPAWPLRRLPGTVVVPRLDGATKTPWLATQDCQERFGRRRKPWATAEFDDWNTTALCVDQRRPKTTHQPPPQLMMMCFRQDDP